VKGYGQYCPIALGAEVFAERWTPIILRNLMVGCHRFCEILEGAPGLPRSVLTQRLRKLEREGVVEWRDGGYHLTAAGAELTEVCLALGVWGARWRDVLPEHLDPYLMLWALSRLIRPERLPKDRVVVRFEIGAGRGPKRYWLVASVRGNEVCVQPPGFEEDGVVVTDPGWLLRWHGGTVSLASAQAAGGIAVTGPPWLVRTLAEWGTLSPFAGIGRAEGQRARPSSVR